MHRTVQDCCIPSVVIFSDPPPTLPHLITEFTDLRLTTQEQEWLQHNSPCLTPKYLIYLSQYRFKPEQVRVTYVPVSEDGMFGNVDIEASGPWTETILWEVPLMACLSESYFQTVATDWNYDGQEGQFIIG